MAGHNADYEHRIRALEETCAACKAKKKRRRKVGFDTDVRGGALDGQTATHEQDRGPDEFGDDPDARRR